MRKVLSTAAILLISLIVTLIGYTGLYALYNRLYLPISYRLPITLTIAIAIGIVVGYWQAQRKPSK